MKKIHLKWKYGLTALVMAVAYACSEHEDLSQMANRPNMDGTRTAEWKTKSVVLESIGTLEAKLTEAMEGEELSTLEKLVISGPMAAADFNYMQNNLKGLYALDMKDVKITASDDYYYIPSNGNRKLKNDTICSYMFREWDSLREIELPSSTLYIDYGAFYNCDSLTSVTIPEGVKILRESTFYGCRLLSSVNLSPNLEAIEARSFYDCDSLKSIDIPDKVKYIGNHAFSYCNGLSVVEFSSLSELDSIANYCFYDTNLKSITIPDKVRTMGSGTFYSCDSLATVVLPSNLNEISTDVFSHCRLLQSISIPDSVKYIGNYAFNQCNSLNTVDFSSVSKLDSIGNRAFNYCRSLTSIIIPDEVRCIGEGTFNGCSLLVSIELPAKLECIGSYAFNSCPFTTIEFPNTLKTISGYAFENCDDLISVSIPEGVEHIGVHAFYGCHGLTELTIPSTITSIEDGFANYCDNLRNVFWNASKDVPMNQTNDYCLLYISTDADITVNECWKNVIKNGVAQSTITIQAENNQKFSIPQEFTAPEVVYKRDFWDETVPGGSSGWQTIVLPFTPDSIYHDTKGRVAPFNSEVEDAKPFWLRELTADGFVDVTSITPDKAYIIAMPNHSAYMDEYCLNGTITFTAKNVTLAKTPEVLESSVGPDFEFHPSYEYKKKALYIYTLFSKWDNYDNMWYGKSFFTRSASDVNPFNAYVTAIGGGRSSRTEFDLDTRSSETRALYAPNNTGVPQIGDM